MVQTSWTSDSRRGRRRWRDRGTGEISESGEDGRSYMKRFHRLDKLAGRARSVALRVVELLASEVT